MKKTPKRRRVSLQAVRDDATLCALPRDHYSWKDWSLMADAVTVWISCQAVGAMPTESITIPKAIFNRLLARYTYTQRVVRRIR